MRWKECVRRDLERAGGEWRTTAKYRRRCKLLTENTARQKWGEKRKVEEKITATMGNITPDDRDNKRRTTNTPRLRVY